MFSQIPDLTQSSPLPFTPVLASPSSPTVYTIYYSFRFQLSLSLFLSCAHTYRFLLLLLLALLLLIRIFFSCFFAIPPRQPGIIFFGQSELCPFPPSSIYIVYTYVTQFSITGSARLFRGELHALYTPVLASLSLCFSSLVRVLAESCGCWYIYMYIASATLEREREIESAVFVDRPEDYF